MKRILRWMILVAIAITAMLSIFLHPARSTSILANIPPISANFTQRYDFGRHFRSLGVTGSIIIYDLNNQRTYQHNLPRNNTRFPTASTFKIFNSLVALETAAITNELSILTWDGIPRQMAQWNRDLNLKEAFKLSAVWFYQVLARRVGYDRMSEYINRVRYGNHNIGSKEDIDRFWLNGKLQISPQEQIKFLQRLYSNDLPFSARSISIVKDIAIVEKTPNYTLRGKTGWFGFGEKIEPQIGWYVGYLEQNQNVYFFATNIDIRNPKDASKRVELTRRCFQDLGLL